MQRSTSGSLEERASAGCSKDWQAGGLAARLRGATVFAFVFPGFHPLTHPSDEDMSLGWVSGLHPGLFFDPSLREKMPPSNRVGEGRADFRHAIRSCDCLADSSQKTVHSVFGL
jgi:hypothetical protein